LVSMAAAWFMVPLYPVSFVAARAHASGGIG
jgi:hypothetical protein